MTVTVQRLQTPGLTFEVATAGPGSGEPVVLLHGFPDLWDTWGSQIETLAAAGFRVIAPNLRGYGETDRPAGVGAYDLERLAADVVAILDAIGARSDYLAGHDWGALVAWWAASRHPD